MIFEKTDKKHSPPLERNAALYLLIPRPKSSPRHDLSPPAKQFQSMKVVYTLRDEAGSESAVDIGLDIAIVIAGSSPQASGKQEGKS